jgi:hypothetical protein
MFCVAPVAPTFDLASARAAIEGGRDGLGDTRLLIAAWLWLLENPHHLDTLPAIYEVAARLLTASGALRRDAERDLCALPRAAKPSAARLRQPSSQVPVRAHDRTD